MGLSSIRSSNNSSWQSQMKRATSEFLPYSILAVLRGQRERGNQRELDYNRKAKDSKILEIDISTYRQATVLLYCLSVQIVCAAFRESETQPALTLLRNNIT